MFHVKHILFFFFWLSAAPVFSQGTIELSDKPFSYEQMPEKELSDLTSALPFLKKRSSEEIELFYWVSSLRESPRRFYDTYIKAFFEQFPEADGAEGASLKADLYKIPDHTLPGLDTDPKAFDAAYKHAKDLAINQSKISHYSSNGLSFRDRMRLAGISKCAGENISEGKDNILEALILLLLDYGVPDKGHRKTLLSPVYDQMGCAIVMKPNQNRIIVVQVFTCR
jgi:hypothetical protein